MNSNLASECVFLFSPNPIKTSLQRNFRHCIQAKDELYVHVQLKCKPVQCNRVQYSIPSAPTKESTICPALARNFKTMLFLRSIEANSPIGVCARAIAHTSVGDRPLGWSVGQKRQMLWRKDRCLILFPRTNQNEVMERESSLKDGSGLRSNLLQGKLISTRYRSMQGLELNLSGSCQKWWKKIGVNEKFHSWL